MSHRLKPQQTYYSTPQPHATHNSNTNTPFHVLYRLIDDEDDDEAKNNFDHK